jgi:hypothetical protein
MQLTEQQVKNYLYKAGFRGSHLNAAVKIAFCESSFNTNAHNTTGEDSRGLMQINVSANANPQYKNYNLFNPEVNTKVAYQIYSNRNKTFKDWTCARTLGLVNPKQTDILFPIMFASLILVLYFNTSQK